jgi:hypothetical protein
MEDIDKSMNMSKEKFIEKENSVRKINLSENNNSNLQEEAMKKFNQSRYVSLFRQDFDMMNLEKWSELICQKSPKRRCYHCAFVYKEYLYIFAGMDINEGKMNDLFKVCLNKNAEDFLKWQEVIMHNSNPPELSYLQGALDAESGKFYCFGGENIYQRYPNELNVLDLERKSWSKKTFDESKIPGMTGHSLQYHSETHSLIIYGGFAKGVYLNQIYIYDISGNSWSVIKPDENDKKDFPCGRMLHSAIILNDYLYIFGGKTGDGIYLNDMWRFNLFSQIWEKIKVTGEVPKGRSGHTMTSFENFIYIFGGKVGDLQERNEFWKFDVDRNCFILIHDTMLEQHGDSQNDISVQKDVSIRKIKSK